MRRLIALLLLASFTFARVALLGHSGALLWVQDETGLRIQFPDVTPSEHVVTLKINGVAAK